MTHRILALHRTDLVPATQLASQLVRSEPGSAPPLVTVLDPVLQHQADVMGLPAVHLLRLANAGMAMEVGARAAAATRLLCARSDALMARLIPQARGAAWCSHWMKILHCTVQWYTMVAPLVGQALQGQTVHLMLPEQPLRYGFHSFVPGLVMHQGLRDAGVHTQLFANPLPGWDALRVPDLTTAPQGAAVELLCHLPTCFYDAPLFCQEVLASGRPALALPSQFFDVETPGLARCAMAGNDALADRLSPTQRADLDQVLDAVMVLLSDACSVLVDSPGRMQRQVVAMVDAFRANALLYFELQRHFGDRPPATLLISNHDAGLHGGLLSYARRHALRTVVVPHSKVFNFAQHSYGHDMLCLTHPLGRRETIDLDGCELPSALLDFAKPLHSAAAAPKPLASLGVVLNSVSGYGLCMQELDGYTAGLNTLLAWCREHGVDCRIRCRPTESSCQMLAEALAVPLDELHRHQLGSLVEFGEGCDLLLGYDVPTSGVFDLLHAGLPVMQTLCRRLAPEEYRIVDDALVPMLSVAQTLQRLAEFHADELQLWQFRRTQFEQQLQAGAAARPLRSYL